ncbi:MAG: PKD domain-containing protein [Candidatus Nanopelagicales bacterium]|nr:PKD domain-containing protein [Candidatus Nanopelagicales bacterium]
MGRRWPALLAAVSLLLLLPPFLGPDRVGAATEVRLVASADFGARAATDTVLTRMAALAPDAALAVGDLAYRDATPESAWCAYVKQRVGEGFPFQLVAGNHESLDVQDGAINNYSACLPNQIPGIVGTYGREYSMDMPKGAPLVRVINASPTLTFEDGKWIYAQGDSHYNWVSAAIDDARAKGARWVVVTAHVPCVSVGVYNCPGDRSFYNLLLSKKVDLVIHGHEHAYMRTHQLRTGVPGCSTLTVGTADPDCVADTDNAYVQGQGTVFATVGTGGTPLRDINPADTEAGYFAKYSGLNLDATYGLLDIRATEARLAADFVPTSGAGMTDAFTIEVGPPPVNQDPVARFTSTTSGLSVTVDGSTSSDVDGTITGYSWSFGDGATATGAQPPAHAYAEAGTYTVSLTVTDDDGATNATSAEVTVTSDPPVTALATDTFGRTVAAGWGTAEVGGAWTVNTTAATSVSSGKGRLTNAAASSRTAYLRSVSSSATQLALSLSPDKVTTGGGLYISVAGRAVVGQGEYRAKLRLRSDARADLTLIRTSATGVETTIGTAVLVPNLTYAAGSTVHMRLEVAGTNPTTIRARAWDSAATEPTTWLRTATDTTAGLQVPGSIGLTSYYSSSATNAPLVLAVDDVSAVVPR